MYDTISATEFIEFYQLKAIDNFNISKMNLKFELHYSVDFIFLSFGIMGFIVEL